LLKEKEDLTDFDKLIGSYVRSLLLCAIYPLTRLINVTW